MMRIEAAIKGRGTGACQLRFSIRTNVNLVILRGCFWQAKLLSHEMGL